MQTTTRNAIGETWARLITDNVFDSGFATLEEVDFQIEQAESGSVEVHEMEERFWDRNDMRKLLGRTKFLMARALK